MTNPPSDVETLREALEKAREALAAISDAYEHILVSHADFRVYARRVADDTLPAIDAALALPGGDGWRPIDDDARLGARCLVGWYGTRDLKEHVELGRFKHGAARDSGWCNTYGHPFGCDPDFYMPLPAPPRAGETE